MTTYVLVHGAWHGGSCWDLVAPLLEAEGHDVAAPTLAAHPQTTLADHVRQVAQIVESLEGEIALVGHSYGGIVSGHVAAQNPERIDHLVLVDGWLAEHGESLWDLAPYAFRRWCMSALSGDRSMLGIPPLEILGVEEGELGDWLKAQLVEHPFATFTDRGAPFASPLPPSRHAIVAAPSIMPFEEIAQRAGFQTTTVQGGHDLMVTDPKAIAELLLLVAAG